MCEAPAREVVQKAPGLLSFSHFKSSWTLYLCGGTQKKKKKNTNMWILFGPSSQEGLRPQSFQPLGKNRHPKMVGLSNCLPRCGDAMLERMAQSSRLLRLRQRDLELRRHGDIQRGRVKRKWFVRLVMTC